MTRIVYSTCSIHAIEDENVVARVLAYSRCHPTTVNGEKHVWVLESRENVLPAWPRRGQKGELSARDAEKVIRCAPEDHTNGFFVSCFKRVTLAEADALAEAEAEAEPEAEVDVEMTEEPAAQVVEKAEKSAAKKRKGKKKASEKSENGPKKEPAPGAKGAEKGGKAKVERQVECVPAPKVTVEKEDVQEKPSKKRPAEDAEESAPKKAKTAAQLERARRKKKAQKAKGGK